MGMWRRHIRPLLATIPLAKRQLIARLQLICYVYTASVHMLPTYAGLPKICQYVNSERPNLIFINVDACACQTAVTTQVFNLWVSDAHDRHAVQLCDLRHSTFPFQVDASEKNSFFQIGTVAFSSSMIQWQASMAACLCGEQAAMITLASVTRTVPNLCMATTLRNCHLFMACWHTSCVHHLNLLCWQFY